MIYHYTLYPLESILEIAFVILIGLSVSYFWSIVALAVLVRTSTRPLERFANLSVEKQIQIESVLGPQIETIKQSLSGSQRHEAIRRLYSRYSYHPVFAARSLFGLAVQLPFFIAAYYMLTGFTQLSGVVVPGIGDLGIPDTLLFGSFHLMPFVMTLVNILALITSPGFSRRSIIQGLAISLMFLALLYEAPLGLLIYWTTSNLFSFISNFFPSIRKNLKLPVSNRRLRETFLGRCFEEYGYLFFVTNLAFLVPLLGVLGDQFNLFTAHGMTANAIISLLLCIALAPALFLVFLRWLAKRFKIVKAFDGAALFIFFGLFLIYLFNKVGYGLFSPKNEPYILFYLTLLAATAVVVTVFKAQLLRKLSYLSLIVPIILLHFIFVSPASTLFKQSTGFKSFIPSTINDTPVFLIIFDEFCGLTIQNTKGELDVLRYPGFAELASSADYFPNALTSHYDTTFSVPSIVSGNLRTGDEKGLAPGANLIEVFKAFGPVNAYSAALPADLIDTQTSNSLVVISDLLTLYLHIILHQDWIEGKIGAIPQTWKGFGIFYSDKKTEQKLPVRNQEVGHFFDWLGRINTSSGTTQFNLLHTKFPHLPYDTTSLGRLHSNGFEIFKRLMKKGEIFDADQSAINATYHNYMQQASYTDRLLQIFVQDLKQKGLYDRSMIVVTSDHGVSYNKIGSSRRIPINGDSWKNIVSVPLFVKYPHQLKGSVNHSFVTTLDISSTILDAVGVESPWESAGENLKAMGSKNHSRSVKLIHGYEEYFEKVNVLFQEARERKEIIFGEGSAGNTVSANYTENKAYSFLLGSEVYESAIGKDSELEATWSGSVKPTEVSFYGTIYNKNSPVNNKVIAAVLDGSIQAVFESGRVRTQEGFFAFSLPESEIVPTEFDVSLYEIEVLGQFVMRKINVQTAGLVAKAAFQDRPLCEYPWRDSLEYSNGLDELNFEKNGLEIISSEDIDPFLVFSPTSNVAISDPIFHIELESNRDFTMQFFYHTVRQPTFSETQSVFYRVFEGRNSIYVRIPESDVSGLFRMDFGQGGPTSVLIRDLAVRH
jgi:hypothetical protein